MSFAAHQHVLRYSPTCPPLLTNMSFTNMSFATHQHILRCGLDVFGSCSRRCLRSRLRSGRWTRRTTGTRSSPSYTPSDTSETSEAWAADTVTPPPAAPRRPLETGQHHSAGNDIYVCVRKGGGGEGERG